MPFNVCPFDPLYLSSYIAYILSDSKPYVPTLRTLMLDLVTCIDWQKRDPYKEPLLGLKGADCTPRVTFDL